MAPLNYYILDVFAEEKYSGNQMAVFRDAGAMPDGEMQRIAREINYSAIAFIVSESERNGGFDARIFTPKEEIPFAGNTTLGTAHIIRTEIIHSKIDKIILNLKVGQIQVGITRSDELAGDVYCMKQKEPQFGKQFTPAMMAQLLSLDPSDIDERYPIEEVSTGLPHIIVPLKSLESLNRARIAKKRCFDFLKSTWAKNILIFCTQTRDPQNNICVRVFADWYGIAEDPATGSGNGCLAGYLVRHRYFGGKDINIRSEQGYEIGRPSLLYLLAKEDQGHIVIWVGGKVIMVARGEFV